MPMDDFPVYKQYFAAHAVCSGSRHCIRNCAHMLMRLLRRYTRNIPGSAADNGRKEDYAVQNNAGRHKSVHFGLRLHALHESERQN